MKPPHIPSLQIPASHTRTSDFTPETCRWQDLFAPFTAPSLLVHSRSELNVGSKQGGSLGTRCAAARLIRPVGPSSTENQTLYSTHVHLHHAPLAALCALCALNHKNGATKLISSSSRGKSETLKKKSFTECAALYQCVQEGGNQENSSDYDCHCGAYKPATHPYVFSLMHRGCMWRHRTCVRLI